MSKEDRLKGWEAENAPEYWSKITNAVKSTQGQVLAYKGSLVKRLKYHSTSGGKTENSINVFGYSEPYLVSVVSPNEETAPKFKSTVVISKEEFVKRIKGLFPSTKVTSTNLGAQIKINSWTDGGRVEKIKVGDKIFTGIDIRHAMGLNSANFSIKVDTKNVTFDVLGYGHGVGMSQWGANIMGKEGKGYIEILKHYYNGVEIAKLEEFLKK